MVFARRQNRAIYQHVYCDNAWSLLQKHVYSDNTSLEVTKPAPKNVSVTKLGLHLTFMDLEFLAKSSKKLSEVWEIGLGSK